MSKATDISMASVQRIGRAFGLKPHLERRSNSQPIRLSSIKLMTLLVYNAKGSGHNARRMPALRFPQ